MGEASNVACTQEELDRGERFLAAFALIEQTLRRKWGGESGRESVRRMVDVLSKSDPAVRQFKHDLEEFSELRNAIVHERVSPDYLIAVPLLPVVQRIESIAQALVDPPRVYPYFAAKVARFSPSDTMAYVFEVMRRTDYTQFPVYNGRDYVGLLTDGAIARWVARLASDMRAELLQATVSTVLGFEKNVNRAKFLCRRATVYEAEDIFRHGTDRNGKWRVSAILITDSGHPSEEPIGIITPSDMLRTWSETPR